MIDDKKIESAANKHIETEYARYNSGDVEEEMICLRGKDSFKAGAKWAINKLLKELWHHANEVPEIGRVIIMENYYPDGRIEFHSNWRKSTSNNPIGCNTQKWFYVDDLLPNGTNVIFKEVKK